MGGGAKRPPLPKICHTYPTMMKLGTVIPYLKKVQKRCESRDTSLEFCWHQHFFTRIQLTLRYQEIFYFTFSWVFKYCYGLLKEKVFWNKGYYIISVHDITNKILSHDSNHIVEVVMWPKFDNSSISMREVIITSIL